MNERLTRSTPNQKGFLAGSRPMLVAMTLFMMLCAPAKSATLFQDDFSTSTGVWSGVDGSFVITGGVYSLSGGFDTRSVAFAGNAAWRDYSFGADFNLTAGSQPCILFHVQDMKAGPDHGHYYQFNVGNNGVAQFFEINSPGPGTRELARATIGGYALNTTHRLSVTIQGRRATAYFDNIPVLSYSGFTNYTYGGIGLKSFVSSTLFDNVIVTEVPLKVMSIDVSEVRVCWITITNASYQLEYSSALTTNAWVPFGGPVAGDGTTNCVFDSTLGQPRRMYRVRELP